MYGRCQPDSCLGTDEEWGYICGSQAAINKATKWKVENSWGAAWGQQKGCLIMSAPWFREYMFRLVVNKKYVSEKILKASEQAPIMVMPEDPLFLPDL